jgi:hypothetical protein
MFGYSRMTEQLVASQEGLSSMKLVSLLSVTPCKTVDWYPLFRRTTPDREFHVVLKIPYVYDYITKLCRTQAEVILKHSYL